MPRIPALPNFAGTVAADDELPLYDLSADTTYGVAVSDLADAVQVALSLIAEAPNDSSAYVREGEAWAAIPRRATIETVSTATHAPATGTDGRYFRCTNTAGCVVTIPANSTQAFPVGTMLTYEQVDTDSAVTFAVAGGVTLRYPAAYTAGTAEQYAVVQVVKVATDEWVLYGHLLAA